MGRQERKRVAMENVGEWAGDADIQRKQRLTKEKRAKEKMDRQEEPGVKFLRF